MALQQQFETAGAEGVKTSKVTCCGRREISSDVVCMLERTDRAAVVWVHKGHTFHIRALHSGREAYATELVMCSRDD